jgi:hypothetical protein
MEIPNAWTNLSGTAPLWPFLLNQHRHLGSAMVTGLLVTVIPPIDPPADTLTPIDLAMRMPAGAGVAGGGVVGGVGGSGEHAVDKCSTGQEENARCSLVNAKQCSSETRADRSPSFAGRPWRSWHSPCNCVRLPG